MVVFYWKAIDVEEMITRVIIKTKIELLLIKDSFFPSCLQKESDGSPEDILNLLDTFALRLYDESEPNIITDKFSECSKINNFIVPFCNQ